MADDAAIKGAAIDALEKVEDPKTGQPLLDTHLIEGVEVNGGEITVDLRFHDDRPPKERWELEDRIYDALGALEGVTEILIDTKTESGRTAHGPPPEAGPQEHGAPSGQAAERLKGRQASGAVPPGKELEGVDCVIAVASGKGGVGKSTVAVNLALALAKLGYATGLLDVDIYGPSLPTLLGIQGRPKVKDRRIVPMEAHGLRIMSLGFLMEEDTPVIWRGPIVTGIIRQFLQDVDWRGTQYLILDLPPGTGDAQLTLAQSCPLDGAIVVTTPSDLALIDAARGLQMFRTLNVDVLGIVENMSHFEWPGYEPLSAALGALEGDGVSPEAAAKLKAVLEEHRKTWIFGRGGGAKEAERLGIPLLGEIPLDVRVRSGGDSGQPIVVLDEHAPATEAFLALARTVTNLKGPKDAAQDPRKKGLFSFLRA
jgi:ATP-binding protein involved in chromosome partitioning